MIDVKVLLKTLSDADLLSSADAYFSQLNEHSEQVKKPFSNPVDAVHISRHLGLVLEAAELFPGADVLDFGCATGWLTLGLSSMGCHAVGVDIAPSAIALANQLKAKRWGVRDGRVDFHVYDGKRLPLADESVDRIVCFDAFHHARDQQATLSEFARILRPGGVAALLEPGPNHSKTEQSQREMAMYNVIENDVSVSEVSRLAREVGFTAVEMLVQMQRPLRLTGARFQQWTSDGIVAEDAAKLTDTLRRQLTDTQCFALRKGAAVLDSRQVGALGADMRLLGIEPAAHSLQRRVRLHIRNTGSGRWINQPGLAGHVGLGAQVLNAAGGLELMDFRRFELPGRGLNPGEASEVSVVIDKPSDAPLYLRFDLVAEFVAWFAGSGVCAPVDVTL